MMKSTLLLILLASAGSSSFALDTSSFYKRKWTSFEAHCKSSGKQVPFPELTWVFHPGVMLDYTSGSPVETPFKFKGNTIMISGFYNSEYIPIDIVPDMFTLTGISQSCSGDRKVEFIFGTGDPDPGHW